MDFLNTLTTNHYSWHLDSFPFLAPQGGKPIHGSNMLGQTKMMVSGSNAADKLTLKKKSNLKY